MYYFIINPHSRSGFGKKIWQDLSRILIHRQIPFQAFLTEHAGHAEELARSISLQAGPLQVRSIVAVGGDGTIQEVLTGLCNLSYIRFGYIPTGSGNDFCRSMGLPRKPEEALEAILHSDRIVLTDIGELSCGSFSGRFAVSCGIGFDAAVCHRISISRLKKLLNRIHMGKLAYLLIGIRQLLFLPSSAVTIETDTLGVQSYDSVFLTAVMNQKYEGGGFPFCPQANPSDGLLDVIVIEGMCRPKLIFCLFLSIFQCHTRFKGVHIIRCKKAAVRTLHPLAVHKDGESAGFQKEFRVSLAEKSLQVIVPQ